MRRIIPKKNSSPKPKMKRWKKWAIAGLLAGAIGYAGYHQRYVNDIFPPKLQESHFIHTPADRPISGKWLRPPIKKAPHYSYNGSTNNANCASFVRQFALEHFGIKYNPGDAWRFAKRNRMVWKEGQSTTPVKQIMRPGQVLGIKWPGSHYNHWARNNTHLFIVYRREGNDIIVVHDFGGEPRMGILQEELKRINGKVISVIEPKEE